MPVRVTVSVAVPAASFTDTLAIEKDGAVSLSTMVTVLVAVAMVAPLVGLLSVAVIYLLGVLH